MTADLADSINLGHRVLDHYIRVTVQVRAISVYVQSQITLVALICRQGSTPVGVRNLFVVLVASVLVVLRGERAQETLQNVRIATGGVLPLQLLLHLDPAADFPASGEEVALFDGGRGAGLAQHERAARNVVELHLLVRVHVVIKHQSVFFFEQLLTLVGDEHLVHSLSLEDING